MMNVPLVLVILGLVAGLAMAEDRLVLSTVTLIALPIIGTALGTIPSVGAQLAAICTNLQMAIAGALATTIAIRLYHMKSVGEVMAIGRNFAESLQKALRGLETGLCGLDRVRAYEGADPAEIESALARTTPDRLLVAAEALREGFTVERINAIAGFDP